MVNGLWNSKILVNTCSEREMMTNQWDKLAKDGQKQRKDIVKAIDEVVEALHWKVDNIANAIHESVKIKIHQQATFEFNHCFYTVLLKSNVLVKIIVLFSYLIDHWQQAWTLYSLLQNIPYFDFQSKRKRVDGEFLKQ